MHRLWHINFKVPGQNILVCDCIANRNLWSSTFKTNTEASKKLRYLGNTLRNPGLLPSGFRTFGATGRYFLFCVSEPLAFWKSGVACAYQPRLSRRVRRCVALQFAAAGREAALGAQIAARSAAIGPHAWRGMMATRCDLNLVDSIAG